jgi:hypothetical protein
MTSIFSKEIVLDDEHRFNYSTHSYEMKNSLGKGIATLEEYVFTSSKESEKVFMYKL